MTKIELQAKNNTKDIKLYSSKAFELHFLGRPLAVGYLIDKNFKALNKPDEERKSLLLMNCKKRKVQLHITKRVIII